MNNELHLNRRQFLRRTSQAATTLAAASTFAPAILSVEQLAELPEGRRAQKGMR